MNGSTYPKSVIDSLMNGKVCIHNWKLFSDSSDGPLNANRLAQDCSGYIRQEINRIMEVTDLHAMVNGYPIREIQKAIYEMPRLVYTSDGKVIEASTYTVCPVCWNVYKTADGHVSCAGD